MTLINGIDNVETDGMWELAVLRKDNLLCKN